MKSLTLERWWPYASGCAGAAVWWFVLGKPFPSDANDLYATAGGAAAVAIGFISTAMTIVLAISGTPVYRSLKQSGYGKRLLLYLFEGVLLGTLFVLTAILGFYPRHEHIVPIYQAAFVASGLTVASMFIRTAQLMYRLLQSV